MEGRPKAPFFSAPHVDQGSREAPLRASAQSPPTALLVAILGPTAQSVSIAAMDRAGAVVSCSGTLGHQVPAVSVVQVGGATGGSGRSGGPYTRGKKAASKGNVNNKGRNKPKNIIGKGQVSAKGPLGPVSTPVHGGSVRKVGHMDLMASLRKRLISRNLSGGQFTGSMVSGGATGGSSGQLVSPCVAPTLLFVPHVSTTTDKAQDGGVDAGGALQG